MSRILKSFFVSCFVFSTFFVAGLVQAHAINSESTCTYQLLCEGQALIFEKIESVMTRVGQISNQELASEMITSLEGARVLAQNRYLGKSLMLINAIDRTLLRELAVVELMIPVEPITVVSTSTLAIIATSTVDGLSTVDDLTHIDKGEFILSQ